MGRKIIKWHLNNLVRLIVATLLNKYDFFIVIEGGTGIGKSTLAFHLATNVAKEFRRLYNLRVDAMEYYYERVGKLQRLTEEEFIEKILKLKQEKAYTFFPPQALIYTQDDLQKFLSKWHGISIPDELINVAFNRDFYSTKQKDIIKMLNMFRDHENLTIACVPQFQNLDNQIKNLTKMKITVKKRGVAMIHTPNSVVYSKDKWDQATNEKIEKDWIIRKITKPNYSKLTTFRGLVKFRPLTRKQEEMYQKIKDEKRAVVVKDDMHIESDDKKDPFTRAFERLTMGGIKNMAELHGICFGMNMTYDTFRGRVVKELKKQNKPYEISSYFWDKRIKKEAKPLAISMMNAQY